MIENNIKYLFTPRSVAVIGAAREPSKVGYSIVKNLLECGYSGKIYPVNPKAKEILGLKVYPTVLDIPGDVDLAVIAVKAKIVPMVLEQCGQRGVKAVIVISAGFKEIGVEGAESEKKVIEIAKKYNIALQGPNCLGTIDTYTPLNASFASSIPYRGNIAFISQSGALCTAILDWSLREKVGFSKFISLGNKAVLDEIDFMEEIAKDDNTKVVLVYIESIEDGDKFLKLMPNITKKKPIVIVKGGVSEEGARAASSHTGALAGSYIAYETAFRQTGVISASGVSDLFDFAVAFSTQPIPKGRHVAIVTNAGGPGILTTDACIREGLKLASFSKKTIDKLKEKLPPMANIYNPVDVIGDAKADRYFYAMDNVMADENVDSLIVLLTPQAMTEPVETAKKVVEVKKKYPQKPILAVFMGGPSVDEAVRILKDNEIPTFDFPENAVRALAALTKYGEYLREPVEKPKVFDDVDKETVRNIIRQVRDDNRVVLLGSEAAKLVSAYGISVPEIHLAKNEDEAVKIAEKIGYPVVLRISSPHILHKSDIGGIAINIKSAEEVKQKFREILENAKKYAPDAKIYGIEVYPLAPKGKEMIVGVTRDPQFGHLIMFGLGGIYVNFLKDVSFGLAPLSEKEAREMVQSTKAYTLLSGIRGEPPSDIDKVVESLLRISQLVTDFPEIAEIDINPLFVYEKGKGVLALDVKIILHA
ncbi:MAG: acetate--CoA ligase alpha subunit [Candidatus Asgardarchaeia archaeon]